MEPTKKAKTQCKICGKQILVNRFRQWRHAGILCNQTVTRWDHKAKA